MAMESEASVPVIALTAAVGAVVLLLVLLCGFGRGKDKKETENEEKTDKKNGVAPAPKPSNKKLKHDKSKKDQRPAFSHQWLAKTLKNHTKRILGLDFSPNGKYLATCGEDNCVILWSVKDFNTKDYNSIRANIVRDNGTQVKFSPDSKAYVVSLFIERTLRIYRLGKKPDGSMGNIQPALDFPKVHKYDIINIGIASSGKFIMSCSSDTTLIIWNIKGEVLSTLDTCTGNNTYAAVSPCGRFVGCAGFTPDVKVWEVCFERNGAFKAVNKAFALSGHGASVYSFDFNADSSRMATVSKDGTWKLWNTAVEYHLGEDPKLLTTGQFNHIGPSVIALSPDARTLGVSSGKNLSIYHSASGKEEANITDAHTEKITSLAFDNNSKYLVSAGDRHVHVFHNIVGYRATVKDLQEEMQRAQGASLKRRIQGQVDDAQAALDLLLGESQ